MIKGRPGSLFDFLIPLSLVSHVKLLYQKMTGNRHKSKHGCCGECDCDRRETTISQDVTKEKPVDCYGNFNAKQMFVNTFVMTEDYSDLHL